MNTEFIIKNQAEQFSQDFGRYEYDYNGEKEFKDDLNLKLYDFYENIDKLNFLYEILKHLNIKIEKHLSECTYRGKGDCPNEVTLQTMKFYLEQEIKSLNPKFDYSIIRPHVNAELITENIKSLEDFPEASKAYMDAIEKLNKGSLERNLLDDLRLSLELLLKSKLNNNKSIENQKNELGIFLKSQNVSKEIRNMFHTLLCFYSKYQNDYVKHNDKVNSKESDLVINLTSTFINFLINKE